MTITVAAWLAGVLCFGIRYIAEWQRILRLRMRRSGQLHSARGRHLQFLQPLGVADVFGQVNG